MKTDELLYEVFRLEPKSVFRLVQLELEGEYTFESITLKTTEKRIDGFLKRTDGSGPYVFVEFQVLPFQEATKHKIVGLLEYAIRQKLPTLSEQEVRNMLQLTPLEETVPGKELAERWRKKGQQEGQKKGQKIGIKKGELIGEIRATQRMLNMPVSPIKALEKKAMTTLRKMLQYLKAEEAEAHGEKIELIGKISLAQQILKQPVSPKETLMENSLEDLKSFFQDLRTELAKLN